MTKHQDILLLSCIRRAILDSFWSRASSTVYQNRCHAKRMIYLSSKLGITPPFDRVHEASTEDTVGYNVAVNMLLMSITGKGKYSEEHLQFDTVRKLRSCYGNFIRASHHPTETNLSLVSQDGSYTRLTQDSCGSMWFHRFLEGMANRMGKVYKPNVAMSTELLRRFLLNIDDKIKDAGNLIVQHNWIVMYTYSTLSYVLSLRGDEGLLTDLKGLRENWANHSPNYVAIVLLGKIKGTKNDHTHIFPCANVTDSGINVKASLKRTIDLKVKLGFEDGPLISDHKGYVWSSQTIDDMMHEVLTDLFDEDRNLFPLTINSHEDIKLNYHCYRTFRRSSDTRAINMKIKTTDIDTVNRWRVQDNKNQGKRVALPMRYHYSDFDKLLGPFLRYTAKM